MAQYGDPPASLGIELRLRRREKAFIARIKELEAALEPFAIMGEGFSKDTNLKDSDVVTFSMQFGMLQRAAKLLPGG